jgi:molybdate transport system permease protein
MGLSTASGNVGSILATTLEVALGATAIAAPLGMALGYALARRRFPLKSVVEALCAVPLILPPTAIGYLLLALFARRGPLGEASIGFDLDVLFTTKAACIASAVVALPLVARTARSAFEAVDPRLEAMAQTLGLSRTQTLSSVTLPLARRGLLAALVLGFGRALGEFGATVIVAGNIPGKTQTLALAIFEGIQLGDDSRVRLLVAITLGLAFVLILCVERLSRPVARATEQAP